MTTPCMIKNGEYFFPEDVLLNLHTHDYYELVYYVTGKGTIYAEEEEYTFIPGTIVLTPPGVVHREYIETASEVRFVCFRTEHELPKGVWQDVDGKIVRLLGEIQTEQVIKAVGYEKMIDAKMAELEILLERVFSRLTTERKRDFTYDVVKYLEENYYKKIILQDIVEDLNYSYGYFQHEFKKKIGMSPQQFLIRKRVEAAKEMLSASGMSCTEIAYACGFATATQMSIIFKKQTGASPTEYRNKHQVRMMEYDIS